MEKPCRHCFELKPIEAFYKDAAGKDGYKATCKSCVLKRIRERRIGAEERPIGWRSHSIEERRAILYLNRLFKRYDGTRELEVPIKVLNHVVPIPKGCVIRPENGRNMILIASNKGLREYQFELIGPEHLLEIIKEMGYKILVPERPRNEEA